MSISSTDAGRVARAIEVAGRLVEDIRAADDEIEALQRNADREEMSQLERKLDGKTDTELDSDTDREMHDLLRSQLRLLQRVSDRLDVATRQRSRQMDLLTAWWREMEQPTGTSSQDTGDSHGSAARIISLCDEAERGANPSDPGWTEISST